MNAYLLVNSYAIVGVFTSRQDVVYYLNEKISKDDIMWNTSPVLPKGHSILQLDWEKPQNNEGFTFWHVWISHTVASGVQDAYVIIEVPS